MNMLLLGNRAKLVKDNNTRQCTQKCCFRLFFSVFSVLYLSSVKVCQDSYKNRPILQAVSRSVITKDPLMDETRHLSNHAVTNLSDPEAVNSMLEQLEPGDTFDCNYSRNSFKMQSLTDIVCILQVMLLRSCIVCLLCKI